MKKYNFLSILMVLVFFIGLSGVSRADTFYQTYQDSGCSAGSFNMPCTFIGSTSTWNPVSICAGNGGITPGSCNSAGGPGLIWYANSLILSHYVTLNTNKLTYKVNETIYPTISATDLDVWCQSKWEKTIPLGSISGSNLHTWTTTGILQGATTFSSPTWVNSFSISTTGPTILYSDYTRSPLTYANDCNASTDTSIDIKGSGIYQTFDITGVLLKLR